MNAFRWSAWLYKVLLDGEFRRGGLNLSRITDQDESGRRRESSQGPHTRLELFKKPSVYGDEVCCDEAEDAEDCAYHNEHRGQD